MLIALVLLAAGAGLVVMGVHKLTTAVPTCDGRPMSPEDVCHPRVTGSFGDGMPEPHSSTYQEQLDNLTSGGWTALGIGVVLLALGVLVAVAWAASRD
ncbi:hypothetical protein ACGF07_07430 [Kitasatospora sp. NPDC048194]|uniref:hypothetical protein n=1 Tax=Kitasatospora sp. NPDC048194 TaxID=3364045 RepID=UPI003721C84E